MAPLATDLVPYREQMGARLWNAADNTRQLIVQHTTESTGGNTSVIGYLERNRNGSYQTMVDFDGEEVRMVPDNRQAWGAGNQGNRRGLHVCAMGRAEWDRARWLREGKLLERTAMRYAEWNRRYGIPLRKITAAQARAGERGILGHIDISAAWREVDHWDPGHHFPYDVVIARAIEINNGGPAAIPEEDDMPSAHEIAAAVWAHRVRKPGAREGHNEPGVDNETAGNLLSWIDLHAGVGVDQLGGDGSKARRDGAVTGWPQLGGRTVVDALAMIGEHLGLEGFTAPKGGQK
ncbi:peptidoglycan recognition protein family protein [Nocardia otitidiscaviarum]|uniref:peptidoglycan recognition protein family protein n=1 Tax=Nocardia otitidiscaviarum TaxID=1823 RepID=UPI0004A743FD|nr:N-acetylmuramoyl-L-alanine amidase [Nocardia otitidiscaviarum]